MIGVAAAGADDTRPAGGVQPPVRTVSPGHLAVIGTRSTPSTATSFRRAVPPETIRTSRRATSSSLASSSIRASLAAPSTATAVTRTLRTPSTTSSIRLAEARGVSLAAKRLLAELKASERAHQDTEHQQDDEPGPIHHPGRWE